MGKRKNKNRKSQQQTQLKKTATKNIRTPLYKIINRIILWLAATGILTFISGFTFDFLTGNVQVQYIKPSGRGYEFKLVNQSSTDQVIEEFRISPDSEKFIFKTTRDIYGELTENGVSMPGGNISYMPAFEYKEMNGYVLHAKSEVNFRIPPLVSKDYMVPESITVFVEYSTKSNNKYMAKLESILAVLKLREGKKRKRYLVVDNYWTPISDGNEVDAIKLACRDDDIFAKSITCKPYYKG